MPPYFCLSPLTPLISCSAALAEVKVQSSSISDRQTGAVGGHGVQQNRGHSEVGRTQGQNVSWRNTAESWKRMRGLENSARTCGEKYSARQALKLHSKAAGVKQCQSCETHRTPLAKTQPRHPNQMLTSQTKYTYSRYTIGLRGILPLRTARLFQ